MEVELLPGHAHAMARRKQLTPCGVRWRLPGVVSARGAPLQCSDKDIRGHATKTDARNRMPRAAAPGRRAHGWRRGRTRWAGIGKS